MMSWVRGATPEADVGREGGCVGIDRRGVGKSIIESNLPRIMVLRIEDARQRYGCRSNGGDCHDDAGPHLKWYIDFILITGYRAFEQSLAP